ncbi:MAG: hypothetical protein QOE61_3194 [Micromonosporaceae bacterium]|jgi:hypothetical protein|nr:hypothetical protein [Micromonosporaceae bacterium]
MHSHACHGRQVVVKRDRSSQVQHLKPDPPPPGFGDLLPQLPQRCRTDG